MQNALEVRNTFPLNYCGRANETAAILVRFYEIIRPLAIRKQLRIRNLLTLRGQADSSIAYTARMQQTLVVVWDVGKWYSLLHILYKTVQIFKLKERRALCPL